MALVKTTKTACWKNNYSYYANYTKVGSPTINNYVASGFSTSNYLTFTGESIESASSFDIQLKITTGSSFTADSRVMEANVEGNKGDSPTGFLVYCNSVAQIGWLVNSTYYTFNAYPNQLSTNTTYWLKWVYDGTTLTASYSLDGTNFITNLTTNPTNTFPFKASNYFVGVRSDLWYTTVWNGSVDLKETYFKVNGNMWWSCQSNNPYMVPSTESYDFTTERTQYICKGLSKNDEES